MCMQCNIASWRFERIEHPRAFLYHDPILIASLSPSVCVDNHKKKIESNDNKMPETENQLCRNSSFTIVTFVLLS